MDALADNEEVALDETLDDLTVPLFPRTQLAGYRYRCVKEVNGLAFAGAAKACGWGFFFSNLLILPALSTVKGFCLLTVDRC